MNMDRPNQSNNGLARSHNAAARLTQIADAPSADLCANKLVDTPAWDLANVARRYEAAVSDEILCRLANQLGVSRQSLREVSVGFDFERNVYTFPECDAYLEVIGIATRSSRGKKRCITGSKRGLTMPSLFDPAAGVVFVVEGPSDVAAMTTLGLSAVGRPSNMGGVEHLEELLPNADVLLIGENDQKPDGTWPGRDGALHVAERLASTWDKPVRWTLPPDGSKDVRQWLQQQALDPENTAQCRQAGRRLRDLLLEAAQVVEPAKLRSARPYLVKHDGIYREKSDRDGNVSLQRLTNFAARIERAILRDDGIEPTQHLQIVARLGDRTIRANVSAPVFMAMRWPIAELGPGAIIYPGQTTKDHARTAIQELSERGTALTVYTHSGWRQIGAKWVYLHGKGAIGESGDRDDVATDLPASLERAILPAPHNGDSLKLVINRWMRLLEVFPDTVILPLLATTFRVVLGPCDFAIHIAGRTGVFKSELAAIIQQHFGAGFDARHLPASWSSTANQLEMLASAAKDMVLVVDDFAPSGSSTDVRLLQAKAERLIRAQGNRSGRGRLTSAGRMREPRPPRGIILSTGEDVPAGHSIRARLLIVELKDGDIAPAALSEAQQLACDGTCTHVMAAFIKWLAPRMPEMAARIRAVRRDARQSASTDGHRRTPDALCDLRLAFGQFLEFCVEVGAINTEEAEAFSDRLDMALRELERSQRSLLGDADPVDAYFDLLSSGLAAGDGHLQPIDATTASSCWEALGWRRSAAPGGWSPQGPRIGWIDSDGLVYLIPHAAYRLAAGFGGPHGNGISVSERTLGRRLQERGLLAQTEGADRLTIKKLLGGRRQRVLCVRAASLGIELPGQSGQSARLSAGDDSCQPDTAPGPNQRPGQHDNPGRSGAQNWGSVPPTGPNAPIAPVNEGGTESSDDNIKEYRDEQ